MSLDEHEALAPFLALLALHVKVTVLTAVGVLRFLSKITGLTLLGQLAFRCVGVVWPGLQALGRACMTAASAVLRWEKTLLLLLCVGLAVVLWLRHHRRRHIHQC